MFIFVKKVILLFVCLFFCGCYQNFKVYKATYQKWCLPDNNIYGVNYHIVLIAKKDYNCLIIDSLYVQDKFYKEFHYSVLGKSNTFKNFKKNDKVLVSVNVYDTINVQNFVIYYTYKGIFKKRLFVKDFIILNDLCK